MRFDGGKKFEIQTMRTWFDERGIYIEMPPPYSPQSNGKAESANRTIKERVRAALLEAGVGDELCAEAAVAAIYVLNRSPKAGQALTPWEEITGERPDVSGLVVWGRPAYALKPAKLQRRM